MTSETKGARPTHRVYAVEKRPGNDKGFWTAIGAAWANKGGYSLRLNLMPTSPDIQIVMREITDEEDGK